MFKGLSTNIHPISFLTTTLREISESSRFHWLLGLILQFWFTWLAMSLVVLEMLACMMVETWFNVFGVRPQSPIIRTQDSAVLIFNAEDGIGRSTALKYSELGYTVFALCPDHCGPTTVRPKRSSDVSSILYSWHLKKERSPDHPWGLVAPIVVDMSSKVDRVHVYETVKAYCYDHSCHLVALIMFPPTYESPAEPTPPGSADTFQHDLSKPFPRKFLPLSLSKDDVWRDTVSHEITDLVSIVQEYIRLLRKSSGRIIIVSGCSGGRFLSGSGFNSLLDDARRSIAHTFSCELAPLGIKVASVVSGPFITPTQRVLDERNVCLKRIDPDIIGIFGANLGPGLLERALRMFAVREEDLLMVIQRITNSRYPKVDHYVGVHPFILNALSVVPSTVFVLVRRWIR